MNKINNHNFFLPIGFSRIIALLILPVFANAEGLSGKEKRGQEIFKMYCVACHGEHGDGKGPASAALNPGPRNFQKADFKFKSTPKGMPPKEEDLAKTIKEGSPGTAMPPWKASLKEDQISDVIAYIKTFNREFWNSNSGAGKKTQAVKQSNK